MKNNKINDLLNDWIVFRDEELSSLTKEDRKHPIHFDEYVKKILNSLPIENKNYVEKLLEELYDDFIDFDNYYNEKYYKAGFGDCLNLVIMSLGAND